MLIINTETFPPDFTRSPGGQSSPYPLTHYRPPLYNIAAQCITTYYNMQQDIMNYDLTQLWPVGDF